MQQFNNDVTIIGAGRVGLPLALTFLSKGLKVNAVDTDENIIQCVKAREMPFNEPGYQSILAEHAICIDRDYSKIEGSAYVIVTVGTPLRKHVEIELSHITEVINQLAPHIKKGQTIILRSTVAPQTTEFVRRYLEEKTGFKIGNAIYLAYCPERISEGNAFVELETLPQIIGSRDPESGQMAKKLFGHLVNEIFLTDYVSAELAKLFSNISRYIYFAVSNHFMILADEFNANIYEIIRMMNHNYPRQIIANPGLTAGTCLRKDFGMINEHIPYLDLLLSSWKVNEFIPNFIVSHILKRTDIHGRVVAVLGYTFKRDSDDFRDSLTPKLVRYIRRQVPKAIRIFEPNLSQGAQFEEDLINTSLETTLDGADIVILAMNHTYFETHRQRILGLCRPDTWFADVWNISRLNKIFFQTMEVAV